MMITVDTKYINWSALEWIDVTEYHLLFHSRSVTTASHSFQISVDHADMIYKAFSDGLIVLAFDNTDRLIAIESVHEDEEHHRIFVIFKHVILTKEQTQL